MSTLQDSIPRVTGNISWNVNDLLKAREKKSEVDFMLHSFLIALFCWAMFVSQELLFKRRNSLCPYLSNDFKQACSRNMKLGKMPFGDDLPKTIEALKAANKIVIILHTTKMLIESNRTE